MCLEAFVTARRRRAFTSVRRSSGEQISNCNLSRLLFGYGVGRILFTGLEKVFQCASIVGRTSIPEHAIITV
jgi:hypothetical protein